jgi:hypothetical protein
MAWSVDHLGRSLPDVVVFLADIHALKVDFYLAKRDRVFAQPGPIAEIKIA